jgi:hypothetical protein
LSYNDANASSEPNAWAVRTDERISSASVAAEEKSARRALEALETMRPPPPMTMNSTGNIPERMSANFQLRTYAIMKPEKKVPREYNDIATLVIKSIEAHTLSEIPS